MRNFLRAIVLRVLYPALMLAGTFFKGKREPLQLFVINLNNRLIRAEWDAKKISSRKFIEGKRKILLLLPHCLQISNCDIRLTFNVGNCKRCGKCEIKDLIGIAEEMGLDIFVATGGTLARRIVSDVRPDAIVAIACERDLSSGIVDTYPLPVFGITNERPSGPCLNTRVDLTKVREALKIFCIHESMGDN